MVTGVCRSSMAAATPASEDTLGGRHAKAISGADAFLQTIYVMPAMWPVKKLLSDASWLTCPAICI